MLNSFTLYLIVNEFHSLSLFLKRTLNGKYALIIENSIRPLLKIIFPYLLLTKFYILYPISNSFHFSITLVVTTILKLHQRTKIKQHSHVCGGPMHTKFYNFDFVMINHFLASLFGYFFFI